GMVRQAGRHGGRTRPPLLGRAMPLGCHRDSQGLPQTGVRQYEIVVRMVERQLLAQARLTLAQHSGPPSNRRGVLAQAEVDALYQRGIDLPAQRTQHLIDGLERTEDYAVLQVDQAPAPYGLDHLRIAQRGQWHPAWLGPRASGLVALRLHPVPIV